MLSVHSGHRERLKRRFIATGLNGFEQHNILELLLFYAIPRGDTNPVAHELISKFGSLAGVFNATESELTEIKGIGKSSARLLKLIPSVSEEYAIDSMTNSVILNSSEEICRYAEKYCTDKSGRISVICMDAKHKLLGTAETDAMNLAEAINDKKMLFKVLLGYNTSCAAVISNAKNGETELDKDDIGNLRELSEYMRKLDIIFLDNIVINNGVAVSRRNAYPWLFD